MRVYAVGETAAGTCVLSRLLRSDNRRERDFSHLNASASPFNGLKVEQLSFVENYTNKCRATLFSFSIHVNSLCSFSTAEREIGKISLEIPFSFASTAFSSFRNCRTENSVLSHELVRLPARHREILTSKHKSVSLHASDIRVRRLHERQRAETVRQVSRHRER